jgi:hypothetical protein
LASTWEQEFNLIRLSTRAIEQVQAMPPLVKALDRLEKLPIGTGEVVDETTPSSRAQEAEELSSLAKVEIESDFRLLHGHSLVGVWGALETMVSDLVLAWLINIPQARQMPQIAGIKISLAEFESLNSEERMSTIVSELDRASLSRAGVARFENLLDAVMLGGSYNSTLAANLYEMQQIRNVVAHRRGVVDRRFVAACPQLGLRVGDLVPLGNEPWYACLMSAASYATTVTNRVRKHFGAPELDVWVVEQLPFKSRT